MTDDEKLIRAKDATRYDIVVMPDERFELMVSRLVRLECPRAFKPSSTRGGGADMVLPGESGEGYERCRQSKHYPETITGTSARHPWRPRKNWNPSATRSSSRAS